MKRLGALLYDSLLIVAIWMATLFVAVATNSGEAIEGLWVQFILALEVLLYYGYCWIRTGQTLGMRAWRLRLVDEDGNGVGVMAIVKRSLLAPFSYALFGIGLLWLYVGSRQQTWHDRFSATYVVQLPKD